MLLTAFVREFNEALIIVQAWNSVAAQLWLTFSGWHVDRLQIMRTHLTLLILSAGLFTVGAQNLSLPMQVVASGGGTSTGSVFRVVGTIGQPNAGGPLTNGVYSLTSGVWALPVAVQTPGAPTLTIVQFGLGQARLSWTPATPGYVLQEATTLTPSNWVDSSGGQLNPVIVPAVGSKFYRLRKP